MRQDLTSARIYHISVFQIMHSQSASQSIYLTPTPTSVFYSLAIRHRATSILYPSDALNFWECFYSSWVVLCASGCCCRLKVTDKDFDGSRHDPQSQAIDWMKFEVTYYSQVDTNSVIASNIKFRTERKFNSLNLQIIEISPQFHVLILTIKFYQNSYIVLWTRFLTSIYMFLEWL